MCEECLKKDAEIAELKALVKEWLCVNCNTVYSGPPQKGFSCVMCPKCSGDCGPRTWMQLWAERARSKALVEALEKYERWLCPHGEPIGKLAREALAAYKGTKC